LSSFEYGFPDVGFSKKDKEAYEYLKDDENSPFQGHTYAEIFIFAMGFAFSKGLQPQPLEEPQKNMPPDAFKPEMRNLMRALAIRHNQGVDVIKEHSEVVKICEEYANAAFPQIYNLVKNRQIDTKPEDILEKLVRETEQSRNSNPAPNQ
jgi:hypothetical protein